MPSLKSRYHFHGLSGSLIVVLLLAGTAVFAFAAGAGLTGSYAAASMTGAVAAGVVLLWILLRPGALFEAAACPRSLAIVAGVMAVAALVQIGRLAVFMVDASKTSYSSIPSSEWEVQHSCLSAYFVAANAAPSVSNVYEDSLYSLPESSAEKAAGARKARKLGSFNVDVYEYPPPFLLLPRALLALAPSFLSLRTLWFALNGGVLLLALWAVAHFMGPEAGRRALLFSPLVWLGFPTITVLQKGNVQVLVIALAMLAMVLFEKQAHAAGGALLAFVIAGKLFPGLLIVYLLARRQFRAVAWTAAFGLGYVVLTFVLLGWAPYEAFLHQLPALLSGEAFPALRRDAATAVNLSIPGLVFKLKLFGVPRMSFGAASIVGGIYTLVAVAATIFAGLRRLPDALKPQVWMAILILATLRSPFLPQAYGAFPGLWLLTLLAATSLSSRWLLPLVITAWAALSVYWPTDWGVDSRLLALANGMPQAVMVLLVILTLRRGSEPPERTDRGARERVPRDAEALVT